MCEALFPTLKPSTIAYLIGRGDIDVPLLEELATISTFLKHCALVIIDDLRLFGRGGRKGDLDVDWSRICTHQPWPTTVAKTDLDLMCCCSSEVISEEHARVGACFRPHVELVLFVQVNAEVNAQSRSATAANHSATHLLHAALQEVLGAHVQQKGSLVNNERFRFDFSHGDAMSGVEINEVERLVNQQVRANNDVETRLMKLEDARAQGAAALFGERYEEDVRVVSMGEFSLELCGGTHVRRTGDIGSFRIISEGGIAAGVRRVEALTGEAAYLHGVNESETLNRLAAALKTGRSDLEERAASLSTRVRELERKVEQLQGQLAAGGTGDDTASEIQEVNGIRVLVKRYDDVDVKGLRAMMDRLKDRAGSAEVVLGGVQNGKATLLVGVSKDLTDRCHAGRLVGELAPKVGG